MKVYLLFLELMSCIFLSDFMNTKKARTVRVNLNSFEIEQILLAYELVHKDTKILDNREDKIDKVEKDLLRKLKKKLIDLGE